MEHDLDVGQLLGPPPHGGVSRLEEVPVHGRRDLGAGLHPQVVAEEDDVDERSHGAQEPLEVGQVVLYQPVEEGMGTRRLAGQEHQEVIEAIEELAGLQEVAAEETDDRPVGGLSQPSGSLGQVLEIGRGRAGRRGHRVPHALGKRLRQMVEVVLFQEWPVALLEVEHPFGHPGNDPARGRAEHPPAVLAPGECPGGHLARATVGQGPVGPGRLVKGEASAHLDGVHPEPLEDILVDDGQLLDRVVNADRRRGQSQPFAEPRIRQGGDSRGPMAGEIDRDPVRFPVRQGGQNTLSRGHGLTPIGSSPSPQVHHKSRELGSAIRRGAVDRQTMARNCMLAIARRIGDGTNRFPSILHSSWRIHI